MALAICDAGFSELDIGRTNFKKLLATIPETKNKVYLMRRIQTIFSGATSLSANSPSDCSTLDDSRRLLIDNAL